MSSGSKEADRSTTDQWIVIGTRESEGHAFALVHAPARKATEAEANIYIADCRAFWPVRVSTSGQSDARVRSSALCASG
jgi:hypothetical protein